MPPWRPAVHRTKWGIIATHVVHNTLRRFGIVRGQIDDLYSAPQPDSEIPHALSRLNHTFEQYLQYGPLSRETLSGLDVLEIGPGNTIVIALRFLAAGAARAVLLDKFVRLQDTPYHRRLYSVLRESLQPEERPRFDAALTIRDRLELNPARLEYVWGRGIEDAPFPAASFDLVISNAVLMEAFDAERTFDSIDRVLRPGGRTIHVIDLADYSLFPKRGFHPLEYLTIPDAIYRQMSEHIGQPNRRLVDFYRDKMASLGYESTIHVTWVLGGKKRFPVFKTALRHGVDYDDRALAMISEIRPRLLERYRRLPDEDLLITGILLSARKP